MSAVHTVMGTLGLVLPLYIVGIAVARGFWHRYVVLYLFLIQAAAFDLVRWATLAYFGYRSTEYAFVYWTTAAVGEIFVFLVLLWLAGKVLELYPSLRLSYSVVMVTATSAAAGWLAASALGRLDPVAFFKRAHSPLHWLELIFLLALALPVLAAWSWN